MQRLLARQQEQLKALEKKRPIQQRTRSVHAFAQPTAHRHRKSCAFEIDSRVVSLAICCCVACGRHRYKKVVQPSKSRVSVQFAPSSPTFRSKRPEPVRPLSITPRNPSKSTGGRQPQTHSVASGSESSAALQNFEREPESAAARHCQGRSQLQDLVKNAQTGFDMSQVQVSADGKVRPIIAKARVGVVCKMPWSQNAVRRALRICFSFVC